jgi:hypothetical protein
MLGPFGGNYAANPGIGSSNDIGNTRHVSAGQTSRCP